MQMDLRLNGLGVEGGRAIAKGIRASRSLTQVCPTLDARVQFTAVSPHMCLHKPHLSCPLPFPCVQINLSRNELLAEGGKATAEAIAASPSLTSANLLGNGFDDEDVSMLLKVKEEKPSLVTLCGLALDQTEDDFQEQGLNPADAKLLAPEIAVRGSSIGSLTQVLAFLSQPLRVPSSFSLSVASQIDFSGNRLCGIYKGWMGIIQGTYNAEGIKAIADAIGISRSLTQVLDFLSATLPSFSSLLVTFALRADQPCGESHWRPL
jgi:hypothetical protein